MKKIKDGKEIIATLRAAHAAGNLNEVQELLFTPTRPKEELYDLRNDPFEINNLAADPAHQDQLARLRQRLDDWIENTNDHGPESEAMYDSDMAVYLNPENPDIERERILRKNIALMKRWGADGI